MMAVSLEPRPMVKAALEMGWLAAARGADIRPVLAMDTLFQPATKTIALTFSRGKTMKSHQYAVGIPCPSAPTITHLKEQKIPLGHFPAPRVRFLSDTRAL